MSERFLCFFFVFRYPFLLAFQYYDGAFARYNTGVDTGAGKLSRATDALRMELVSALVQVDGHTLSSYGLLRSGDDCMSDGP